MISSSHLSGIDFSHLSRYHFVHSVKPLKHNHEALYIAQADIAALILLWSEYAIINAPIEVAYCTISIMLVRLVVHNHSGIFEDCGESTFSYFTPVDACTYNAI